MSIIIKGMKMPTARDTLVLVKTDGTAIVYVDEAYVTTAYPVPPHGRLIDADVRPVVRGEWYNGDRNEGAQKVKMDHNGNVTDTAYCSVCGDWLCASDEYAVRGRFCPNCGADMRGNDKEKGKE